MLKGLILGATGGCGRKALAELLSRGGVAVTAVVRSESRLPPEVSGHQNLSVVVAPEGHLALSEEAMRVHLRGCDAVVCCLGHNLNFRGVFGHPKRLCTDTTRQICEAFKLLAPEKPVRYIVVSTEGVDRPDGADPERSRAERFVFWLLSNILPPHADNMANADYLHSEVSGTHNPHVDFCAVRPSSMIDAEQATEFTTHDTLQCGLFNPGTTTRANVGAFMADLVTEDAVWEQWKDSFPHILDKVGADADNAPSNNAVAPQDATSGQVAS